MAQNVTIAGADYVNVPGVQLSKSGGGTVLFVDTSEDTVTPSGLLAGQTAHDGLGNPVTGTFDPYPVGSIYMSVNSTDPGTLFGGRWERIQDRFLLAAGSAYPQGATGGETAHTLTAAEMPVHTHVTDHALYGGSSYTTPSAQALYVGEGTPSGWVTGKIEAGNTGGGAAHNNLPPYLAVCIWKRTA